MVDEQVRMAREELTKGIRLSGQMSYGRRQPDKASVPFFESSRDRLELILKQNPSRADAWRLLSQAEECLLNYPRAVFCLERALKLEGACQKKDLKKLAQLKEYAGEWNALPLTPEQVQSLGSYLTLCGADNEPLGRTLEHTRTWLAMSTISSPESVLDYLRTRGLRTDFEIYHNLVRG